MKCQSRFSKKKKKKDTGYKKIDFKMSSADIFTQHVER